MTHSRITGWKRRPSITGAGGNYERHTACSLSSFRLPGARRAGAVDRGWHLRVFAAGIDPHLDETITNDDGDDIRVTGGTDLGFGASLEYQFSNLLGLELGAFTGSPDITLSAEIPGYGHISLSDGMSTRVITLDLDLHLTPSRRSFDFYVGGGMASVGCGDLHYDDPDIDPFDIVVSDDFIWSVKAGLDIALGKNSNWAAVGGIRYINLEIEVRQVDDPDQTTVDFDFNIVSFSVGVAYSI